MKQIYLRNKNFCLEHLRPPAIYIYGINEIMTMNPLSSFSKKRKDKSNVIDLREDNMSDHRPPTSSSSSQNYSPTTSSTLSNSKIIECNNDERIQRDYIYLQLIHETNISQKQEFDILQLALNATKDDDFKMRLFLNYLK